MASFLLLPELTARLTDIKAHPGDHARVAALAAWLGESKLASDRAYGEFIGAQQELLHLKEGSKPFEATTARADGLLRKSGAVWEGPWRARGVDAVTYEGGVPVEVKLPAARFLTEAEALLAQVPTIVAVEITQMQGDADVEAIAACPTLGRVEQLDVGQAELGDRGAASLASSPHVGRLRTLELWFNQIGDAGAESLAEAESLSGLRHLNLWSNPLGDAGRTALAHSTTLRSLRQLDVENPAEFIERAGAARDQARQAGRERPLPKLRVINGKHYNEQWQLIGQ